MRYPHGGGLTAERRTCRERIRLEAAEMFAAGQDNTVAAKQLRAGVRPVQRWHRAWPDGGRQALHATGPAARPKLNETLFTALEREPAKGPTAHGRPDQTWTLARITTLIGRRFHQTPTLSTIARMLRRHGWSHQVLPQPSAGRYPPSGGRWSGTRRRSPAG